MDPIEHLVSFFEKFPGVGPRQAQRFVQFLLRSSASSRRDMARSIEALAGSVHQCKECMRFFAGKGSVCGICSDTERDRSSLMVVASDSDLLALERAGTYRGTYFVLGGTVLLGTDKSDRLRIKQLLGQLPERTAGGLQEIVLAFPANPEGDATAERLRYDLSNYQGPSLVKLAKVTALGRGLSTGSELEYADPETLRTAFDNRR